MALTKKQKGMIRDYLEFTYSADSYPSPFQDFKYSFGHWKTKEEFEGKREVELYDNVEKIRVSETFHDDFMNEIKDWEFSQADEVKVKRGRLIVGSTVGKERTKKAREERKKIVDRLERRKEKVKTKVLIV